MRRFAAELLSGKGARRPLPDECLHLDTRRTHTMAATIPKRSAEGWNLFSTATQVVLSRWHILRTAVVERVRYPHVAAPPTSSPRA